MTMLRKMVVEVPHGSPPASGNDLSQISELRMGHPVDFFPIGSGLRSYSRSSSR